MNNLPVNIQMQQKSRKRQVRLARLCYKNAKRYLRDAKLLKKDRSYGHAYALVVLGIEQLGMAFYWFWSSIGLMKFLPKDFTDALNTKPRIQKNHEKKQFLTLMNLITILAVFVFWAMMKKFDEQTKMKKVINTAQRKYLQIIKRIAKTLKNFNRKKFQGLYVDGSTRINTHPFQFHVKDVNDMIVFLDMMLNIFRLDKDRCYSIRIDERDIKLVNNAGEIAKDMVEKDASVKDYKKMVKKEVVKAYDNKTEPSRQIS
jgi:AbiV family abortive infection protein